MKRRIRIFSFPSHSPRKHISGVDYPRVIQPMTFLGDYSDSETIFEVTQWDGEKMDLSEWNLTIGNYDILFFNYMINDWAFASMGSMARKHGVKMVMDLDDACWHMNTDNTVYDLYKKGSKGIETLTSIVNEVDYVTCTNSYLKNVIANNSEKTHDKIKVFPNCVDLELYKFTPEFRQLPYEVVITHYGSSSHYTDLNDPEFVKGIDMVMQDFPNVRFLTVGSSFSQFKNKWGARYEQEFGALNFLDWVNKRFPEVMARTDIFVAPLTNNLYNRCKSDIKRSEVATTKRPFVGQNIRQYQEVITHGVDGYLCQTAKQWYDAISELIKDKDLRVKIGEAGYDRMTEERLMEDYVQGYADFFKDILDKDKNK